MKIRSFIAVDPPLEVISKIEGTIQDLKKQTGGIRWLQPEGFHMTLRFLGEVEEEILIALREKLSQLVMEETPISLAAKGIGFFPNASRPHIVWVGLEGETEKLEAFQRKIHQAVEALPVHPEKGRKFFPHITIGRIAGFHGAAGIAEILEAAKSADFGKFVSESLFLYKSNLTPEGARYTKLETFNFGRP